VIAKTIEEYRRTFTAFYESLVDVYPEQFADGTARRIGSTYRVPGAAGLDAQTFYMQHILDLVFERDDVVHDLVTLARAAYRGTPPPPEAVERVSATAGLHDVLYRATEAASSLTGHIGAFPEGTDLFANILNNTDCALQMAGIYDHAAARHAKQARAEEEASAASADTMDQSAIDALFG
jgi:hypothetical protein